MTTAWRPTAPIATLEIRASMLRAAREYFTATRALEVDTPTISSAAVTDVHLASVAATTIGRSTFMHTSPEYAMKRLLAAGCGDIWQICKVFRDGESGRWHNPEFTMIEWYRVGYDHHSLMSDVERLISAVLPASRQFDRAERLTYREAMQLLAGVGVFQDATPMLVARLQSAGIEVPPDVAHDRDACLDLIMGTMVGPQLGLDRLTFIYDYPASQAALARVHGPIASPFEPYVDVIDRANGFHELGDPQEQRSRFERGLADHNLLGLPVVPI